MNDETQTITPADDREPAGDLRLFYRQLKWLQKLAESGVACQAEIDLWQRLRYLQIKRRALAPNSPAAVMTTDRSWAELALQAQAELDSALQNFASKETVERLRADVEVYLALAAEAERRS